MNTILDMLPTTKNDIYFDPLFQQCIETYLPNLKAATNNTTISIEPAIAHKYEGDLYGLLINAKVAKEHIWITMRLNGYRAYSDYDGKRVNFIVPPQENINDIIQRYKTSHKVL